LKDERHVLEARFPVAARTDIKTQYTYVCKQGSIQTPDSNVLLKTFVWKKPSHLRCRKKDDKNCAVQLHISRSCVVSTQKSTKKRFRRYIYIYLYVQYICCICRDARGLDSSLTWRWLPREIAYDFRPRWKRFFLTEQLSSEADNCQPYFETKNVATAKQRYWFFGK